MWTSTLVELNAQVVKSLIEVHPARALHHAVHAVVRHHALTVDPQFRAVVAGQVEGPVVGPWHVDKA